MIILDNNLKLSSKKIPIRTTTLSNHKRKGSKIENSLCPISETANAPTKVPTSTYSQLSPVQILEIPKPMLSARKSVF